MSFNEVPVNLEVSNYVGFNLNNTELNLGAAYPGGKAQRNMTITNTHNKDARIHILVTGEIGEWTNVPNDFVLSPSQSRSVKFVVSPPPETPYGNYTETVRIFFYKN